MILQRYLFREISTAFGGVFVLLLLIFLSRNMVEFLSDAAAGRLAANAIFSLLGLLVLSTLGLLVPLCFFAAVMLALGRMQRDGELIAMTGAGLGARHFHKTVSQLALVFASIMAFSSLYLSPWADRQMKTLEARAQEESDITGITPGRFKEFSEGDRVLFVRELSTDKQEMREVFLQTRERGKLGVLASDGASLVTEEGTGNRFVVFADGRRYLGVPGQADYQITRYARFGVRIDRGEKEKALERTKSMPTSDLIGSDNPLHVAELQWRISVPISTLLLAVFAVALTRIMGQDGRYGALLVAVLVYFTYNNTLGIARSLVKKGDLPGYVGLWWVHLLLLGIIVAIEFYPAFRRWRRGAGKRQLPQRP